MGKIRQTAQAILLVTSAVVILVTAGAGNFGPIDIIGLVPAGVAGLLHVIPGKDKTEKKLRKKVFEDARYSWHLWEKKWKTEAGDTEFLARLKALTDSKERYETIEREYKNALAALQHTSREHQLKKFLETCLIETCTSPRLSETQKAGT